MNKTKSLKDYGLNIATPLIRDMAKTWGDCLENMPEEDLVFLIGQLGVHYYVKHCYEDASAEAAEAWERRNELSKHEVGMLITFLANK